MQKLSIIAIMLIALIGIVIGIFVQSHFVKIYAQPKTPQLLVSKRTTEENIDQGLHDLTVLCKPDEVVTGGGFDVSGSARAISSLPAPAPSGNQGWAARFDNPVSFERPAVAVFAECLKLS